MGNYNPSAPIILGNEWVGIRDENTQLSPIINVAEYGHTFSTTTPYTLQDGRFYVNEMPANTGDAVYVMGIYPQGQEACSGPVKRLVIPTESVLATGATLSSGSGNQALLTPYFGNYYFLSTSQADSFITLSFNTQPYTILNGKRIVRVALLYAAQRFFNTDERGNGPIIYLADGITPYATNKVAYSTGDEIQEGGTLQEAAQTLTASFGEVSRLWQSPVTYEVLPWNYADLQRFDASSGGTKLYVQFVTGSNWTSAPAGGIVYIWYAALEVLYCEEQRIIIGGNRRADAANEIRYGANPIQLRSIARALNPSLAAGDWTITISAADQGGAANPLTGYPDLNALRELYEIPTHAGVQVNLTQTPGDEFESIQTHILPQLSLHTSGAPLTEVHSYGRQYAAPVYDGVVATQEIYDDLVGGSASFPQIRFWARRFGCTSADLYVSGTGTAAGAVASISVSDFDELDDILDGWKEVNLRFGSAPTMGALTPDPTFTWISPSATAGSRWEVLAVAAPAVSGIPGDLLQLVLPASQQLPTTTYQPPVGSTVELITLSDYASGGVSARTEIDACVLFSQDPYTVTGLAISLLSQEITGIGVGCGDLTPCCIPTAIQYHRLTWPTLAMSSSGFGAFELQRWDAATDWQTIMSATDPALTSFNDYEARVGTASVYRMRVLNLYRFAGAWSDQVTGTVTGSGVTVQCATDPAGVLIFTSNSTQSGSSNLAYVSQFDRSVEEAFAFTEAGTQQLRRHYRRDYVTAYRPTERGGESFTRSMLIQGAAGAIPNMANMRSLRDLAWADLPYVCVRDELGNRWFANVNVPAGVISQRSTYLATVDITEVTATATEVDP